VTPSQWLRSGGTVRKPGAEHEIEHDGYRMIARGDGPTVRLYSRNAYDWTARLSRSSKAFDLTEHDGEDLRNLPFLDRKAALAAAAARRPKRASC
jgi:ATP-dependent DNA ligase